MSYDSENDYLYATKEMIRRLAADVGLAAATEQLKAMGMATSAVNRDAPEGFVKCEQCFSLVKAGKRLVINVKPIKPGSQEVTGPKVCPKCARGQRVWGLEPKLNRQ